MFKPKRTIRTIRALESTRKGGDTINSEEMNSYEKERDRFFVWLDEQAKSELTLEVIIAKISSWMEEDSDRSTKTTSTKTTGG